MKKIYAMILSMTLAVLYLSCKSESTKAIVLFYSGKATVQHMNEHVRPVQVQEEIKNGDVIETGEKSSVVIQAGSDFTVRFEENTAVIISSITDISKREINLNKGKVLSRVSKLQRGYEYMIKTPTAVASVRGTEFLTDYSGGKTTVAVGKGKVSVVKTVTSEEKLVDPGKAVVVAENVEMRDINQVETIELKKLENTPVIKNPDSLKQDELDDKTKPVIDRDKLVNDEIEKLRESTGMSFDAIKSKFRRIDVVTLYNGRVIKGTILSRGKELKIITPNGIVTINSKDVRKTGVM